MGTHFSEKLSQTFCNNNGKFPELTNQVQQNLSRGLCLQLSKILDSETKTQALAGEYRAFSNKKVWARSQGVISDLDCFSEEERLIGKSFLILRLLN